MCPPMSQVTTGERRLISQRKFKVLSSGKGNKNKGRKTPDAHSAYDRHQIQVRKPDLQGTPLAQAPSETIYRILFLILGILFLK